MQCHEHRTRHHQRVKHTVKVESEHAVGKLSSIGESCMLEAVLRLRDELFKDARGCKCRRSHYHCTVLFAFVQLTQSRLHSSQLCEKCTIQSGSHNPLPIPHRQILLSMLIDIRLIPSIQRRPLRLVFEQSHRLDILHDMSVQPEPPHLIKHHSRCPHQS